MRPVFVHNHSISYFQHIRIIPLPGSRILPQPFLLIQDLHYAERFPCSMVLHTVETVVYITCCSPEVTNCRTPLPGFIISPFANTQHYRSAGLLKSCSNRLVSTFSFQPLRVTPIILQVVNSPLRIRECILKLISSAARPAP